MDDQTQQAQFVPQDDQVGNPVPINPDEGQAVTVEPEEQEPVEEVVAPEAPAPSQSDEHSTDQSMQYDEEIKSDKIETKRKTFFLDLKANSMGRYTKISERSSGKRSTIIIPEENIQEFVDKLQGLFK